VIGTIEIRWVPYPYEINRDDFVCYELVMVGDDGTSEPLTDIGGPVCVIVKKPSVSGIGLPATINDVKMAAIAIARERGHTVTGHCFVYPTVDVVVPGSCVVQVAAHQEGA
jgi:hypothetical protein